MRRTGVTTGPPTEARLGTEFPALRWHISYRGGTMDKEHLNGAADKAKGAIKDTIGKLTGKKKMQAEGKVDKAQGSAHNIAGDVKDASRKAAKSADR
jgi:uncharacterized protein YjbJ (UPF0337 family)